MNASARLIAIVKTSWKRCSPNCQHATPEIKTLRASIFCRNGHKIIDINRRRAIRERCLICSDWSPKEVTNCGFIDCPLYPFRTGQGKQDPAARAKAIRSYCMWCTCDQPKEIRLCPSIDCPLYEYRGSSVDRSIEISAEISN